MIKTRIINNTSPILFITLTRHYLIVLTRNACLCHMLILLTITKTAICLQNKKKNTQHNFPLTKT